LPFAPIASIDRSCSRSATAPATGSTGFGFTVVVVVVVGTTVVVVVLLCTARPAAVDVVVDGAGESLRGALPPVVAAKKPATNTSASALEPTSTFFTAQPFARRRLCGARLVIRQTRARSGRLRASRD